MKPLNEQIDAKFVIQAKKLTQLTQLLHKILPVECRNHVEVANIRQKILMLITDSPVWTTRLRQLSPQILQYIQQNSAIFDAGLEDPSSCKTQTIQHVQISTRYHAQNTDKQQPSSNRRRCLPQISKKTADLLSQSANSINDPKLRKALLKIASHGNGSTGKDSQDSNHVINPSRPEAKN